MKKLPLALLCTLVTLIAFCPAVRAQSRSSPDQGPAVSQGRGSRNGDIARLIDGLVPAQLAENKIPGAAVVVVKDGAQVFAKGYGVADVASRRPVDPASTAFFLGSTTKLFTATAVMQLVRAGRLSLDQDVNRYLTTFKIENTYPGRPVTLRHLLTYTAGFDEHTLGLAERDPNDVVSLGRSVEEWQPERVRPPGTRVAYDNYGIALAGFLVEAASKQPFADYVREHVLSPVGMSGTSVALPHPAAFAARLAKGYRPSGTGFTAERGQYGPWTPSGTGPAATPADMGRFMIAQLGDDPALGGAAVTRPLRSRQYTQIDPMPGMGFTFEERPRNGHPRYYKDGDVPGFHNVLALMPEQRAGVYVVYNGDGANGDANWLAQRVANAVTDHYAPAARAQPVAAPATKAPGDATRYSGTYRANRTSNSDLTRFNSLIVNIKVSAGKDGTLTTTGVSPDPAKKTQHWNQVRQGLFIEKGGQDRLAFDGETLVASANPAESYQRLAWYDEPSLHLTLLIGGAFAFIIAFFAFPVLALVRGLRHRPAHPLPARLTRAQAWLAAALTTVFLVAMALAMSDGNALMEAVVLGSPHLTVLPYIATASFVAALPLPVALVGAWWKNWWRLPGRIAFTLLVLLSVPFFKLCVTYHLLALPFPTT
ncbi:beta-lactamase family protein [Actinomadura madurae]|uniref:serine hydrolase domain-containing protein n=1 Tax=Actinomadura madurae TaxID=1993 RepID=UPI002027362E|nr:serine hydrolase domain-containing protein [Actinomadura madurae]URN03748.1 beta-lactamase family protein [Actinomadura madurae]